MKTKQKTKQINKYIYFIDKYLSNKYYINKEYKYKPISQLFFRSA